MNEFSLINTYFKSIAQNRKDVVLGIGDDAACLNIPPGESLLVSTDTLVSGVHFLPQWNPCDIAYKAVMVNISDMAAMAAKPCWLTLAVTLPEPNPAWLSSFSQGIKSALEEYQIDIIGGDTTRGPLSITISILGLAPVKHVIRRSTAKPGDLILVSGTLGAAALAVKTLDDTQMNTDDKSEMMHKLMHPKPRVDLVEVLRKYASSAIDISDGLGGDLHHICEESGIGACLYQEKIPTHPLVQKYCSSTALDLALSGGDDYELCFTVPEEKYEAFTQALSKIKKEAYLIGVMEEEKGMRMRKDHTIEAYNPTGYTHFK